MAQRIVVFDAHGFERPYLDAALGGLPDVSVTYVANRLDAATAALAAGATVACSFANDHVDAACIAGLQAAGVKLLSLRCAGFNHVDLAAAARAGLPVVRVPEYSPYAVAEHAMALLLTLNRKTHKAWNRVREGNFSVDGLVGFDLHGCTAGVVGVGRIGKAFARIARGFGMELLLCDPLPDAGFARDTGARYVDLATLLADARVISLHVPLTPQTRHLIGEREFARMQPGAFLLNTGRGALVDARALVAVLKSGRLGGAGLDVYEEEEGVFFENLSERPILDDTLARLVTFPNVLVTSHQGFLTRDALRAIAETTARNIREWQQGKPLTNEVRATG